VQTAVSDGFAISDVEPYDTGCRGATSEEAPLVAREETSATLVPTSKCPVLPNRSGTRGAPHSRDAALREAEQQQTVPPTNVAHEETPPPTGRRRRRRRKKRKIHATSPDERNRVESERKIEREAEFVSGQKEVEKTSARSDDTSRTTTSRKSRNTRAHRKSRSIRAHHNECSPRINGGGSAVAVAKVAAEVGHDDVGASNFDEHPDARDVQCIEAQAGAHTAEVKNVSAGAARSVQAAEDFGYSGSVEGAEDLKRVATASRTTHERQMAAPRPLLKQRFGALMAKGPVRTVRPEFRTASPGSCRRRTGDGSSARRPPRMQSGRWPVASAGTKPLAEEMVVPTRARRLPWI